MGTNIKNENKTIFHLLWHQQLQNKQSCWPCLQYTFCACLIFSSSLDFNKQRNGRDKESRENKEERVKQTIFFNVASLTGRIFSDDLSSIFQMIQYTVYIDYNDEQNYNIVFLYVLLNIDNIVSLQDAPRRGANIKKKRKKEYGPWIWCIRYPRKQRSEQQSMDVEHPHYYHFQTILKHQVLGRSCKKTGRLTITLQPRLSRTTSTTNHT
jgi:hypothetical protein